MANDREILREIWDGKLPICFKLDPDEVIELQQPDPFYLMVPRVSYFPLVIDKVRKHFLRYVASDKLDQVMWLEYNGQPLKWHYPIGVLFDLLVSNNDELPWLVTAHFEKLPEEHIYDFKTKELVEAYFMSCLKEADFLKYKGQIVNSMQIKDHNQLWMGLQNDKFDQFWAVNRKLMEVAEYDNFRHIPFRCYIGEGYKQSLVKPMYENGQHKLLKDLLGEVFPGEYRKAKTHGIYPSLETPIQWMSEHLSYPDNFLHLCVE